MTQPIKKKYLGDDQIDGDKILLEQGQSILGLDSQNQEAPLIGFDQDDNVLIGGNLVATSASFEAEQTARVAADEAINLRIDNLLQNLDPEAIDSFTEVVAELQSQQDNLIAVDQALQASIASEEQRAVAAEQTLQSNIDTVQSNLDTETQERIAADNALSTRVDSLLENLDPEAIDSFTEVVAELQTQQSNLIAVDQALQASIASEEARASAAEQLIANNLAQEIQDREEADAQLQFDIDALDVYAQETRVDLDALDVYAQEIRSDLDQEISDRTIAVSNSLNEAKSYTDQEVLTEKTRAEAAESLLQSNLDTESQNRINADGALSARLDTLETDPVTKSYVDTEVNTVQLQVNNIISNTDPAALDSLSEIVEAFQAADSNINQLITNLGTSSASALAQAVQDLELADATIQGTLDQEIADRESLEGNFNNYVSSNDAALALETSERISADTTLQSNIDSENLRATTAEASLQDALTIEQSERISSDNNLQVQIDSEISRASLAESNLSDQLQQEITDRTTEDENLQDQIDALDVYAQEIRVDVDALDVYAQEIRSDLDSEISERESSVSSALQEAKSYTDQEVLTEKNRAETAEALLQSNIESEESGRIAADTNLSNRLDVLEQDPVTKGYVDGEVTGLQNQINFIVSNNDPDSLDSLVEVVTAFQQADNDLNGAITSLAANLDSALNNEIADRIAGDANLQNQIDSEIVRATGAESLLQTQITDNLSAFDTYVLANDQRILDAENRITDSEQEITSIKNRVDIVEDIADNNTGSITALTTRVGDLEAKPHYDFHQVQIAVESVAQQQYIDLNHIANVDSLNVHVQAMKAHETRDFTVSEVDGKTRITWVNTFALGGIEEVAIGETVYVSYSYQV